MNSPSRIDLLDFQERGQGRPLLALHGGAGPLSIAGFVEAMSATNRVLAPTHPGFEGTPPIAGVETVAQLAALYAEAIRARGLSDILLVGLSFGGWIAAELAVQAPGLLRGLVLVDAIGIEVTDHPVANIQGLAPPEIAKLSWHAPEVFIANLGKLPPERLALMATNLKALKGYGTRGREAELQRVGTASDPTLRERLGGLDVPALVVWGESDRIATPAYGRVFAQAIPGARFELVPECGHSPQLEQPARLIELVRGFDAHDSSR